MMVAENSLQAVAVIMCDVCGLDPAIWQNKALLKSDARLCKACFELWYEEGITSPMKMRQVRVAREAAETGFRL